MKTKRVKVKALTWWADNGSERYAEYRMDLVDECRQYRDTLVHIAQLGLEWDFKEFWGDVYV